MADTRTWQTYAEGSFKTLHGNTIKVQIQKLQAATISTPLSITFPASEPLVIEWKETEKHEAVCSSAATLKVLSTTFQMYMSLYTVETGSVRMLVYKNGSLYWSGFMDTEMYEEPFNRNKNYGVKLTFTDLGVLNRAKFDMENIPTLREVINAALDCAGVQYSGVVEYISTKLAEGSSSNILDSLVIQSANFYDEDDEPSTWKDVLEEILVPLALRLICRNNKVYIYDINYLCDSSDKTRQSFSFSRDDQNIEMDSVYNKIKTTFSPYSDKTVYEDDIEISDSDYYKEADLLDADKNYDEIGVDRFKDITEDDKTTKHTLYYKLPYSDVVMMTGGEEFTAYMLRGAMYSTANKLLKNHRNYTEYYELHNDNTPAFCTDLDFSKKWVPFFPSLRSIAEGKTYQLYLKLSTYFAAIGIPGKVEREDNYFPTASETTLSCGSLGGANWFGFMRITLYGVDGKTYHLNQYSYEYNADWNKNYTWSESETHPNLFIPLNSQYGFGYDWMENEYSFPVPPVAGYLQLEVSGNYGSWIPSSWTSPTEDELETFAYGALIWYLIKSPEMYLRLEGSEDEAVELEDIETSKEANTFAEDELDIDTKCGSSKHLSPISRGVYILKDNAVPMSEGWDTSNAFHSYQNIYRAGKTDTPESLLIRTLMAQHITRHLKLTGSVDTIDCAPTAMRCTDISGKDFLITAENADLHNDLSELTLVEISPDAAADDIDYKSENTKFVDSRPRAQRLRDNNLALVKKDARLRY